MNKLTNVVGEIIEHPAVKKCPICLGRGIHSEIIDGDPNHTLSYVCKGCDGHKWIEIDPTKAKQ